MGGRSTERFYAQEYGLLNFFFSRLLTSVASTVDFMVQRVVQPLHYTIKSIERAKGKEKCKVTRITNLMDYQLPAGH